MRSQLCSALLISLCSSLAAAQDSPAPGFAAETLAVAPPTLPGGPFGLTVFGVARTLANGDVVTFDGLTVRRLTAGGTLLATLGTLPQAVFPGAFALAPDEAHALVGDGSAGVLYRVELDGGGLFPIGSLANNFDAVFKDAGTAYVSANKSLSFTDNHIVRVDLLTGAEIDECFVSGPSGPVALDPQGNLYYGIQDGAPRVLRWTAAQLAGGALLGEVDAEILSSGWTSIGSLAFDPIGLRVYLAENDFATGANALYRAGATKESSPVVVEGTLPFNFLGGLEFVGSSCAGLFEGYQPDCGGTLRYSAVDFVSVAYRAAVEPARPAGSLTGPGTAGPGFATFHVDAGPPSGFAHVFFGPTSAWSEPEAALLLPGAQPLFTGLLPGAIDFVGGLLALDAGGSATIAAYHPGGLLGLLTVQSVTFHGTGAIAGTSTAAHL